MKTFHLIGVSLLSCGVLAVGSSCGPKKEDTTKFSPTQKESTLSDSEREAAIAEKRASLSVDGDSIFLLQGVKFSVLPPAIAEGVDAAASELLASRLISIAAMNGVGGLPINPVLGLVTRVERTESSMTTTAPQQTAVSYSLTFYCGNFISDEIYASATTSVSGVGANLDEATLQAFREVKDSQQIKEMFKTASEKALKWYATTSNISMAVDQAIATRDYALAMGLLSSVPAQSPSRAYAEKKNTEITALFFESKADELYGRMMAAIAASDGHYNPEAGAMYALIPHNSKIWDKADKAFMEYCKTLESDRREAIASAKAEKNRQDQTALLLELERLQVEKAKAPYEMQATLSKVNTDAQLALAQINADSRVAVAEAQAMGRKYANTGGFFGLGRLWDGAFGIANRIMDKFEHRND